MLTAVSIFLTFFSLISAFNAGAKCEKGRQDEAVWVIVGMVFSIIFIVAAFVVMFHA